MRFSRIVFSGALALGVLAGMAWADVAFVRGDTNADGVLDVIDSENISSYLFAAAERPPCLDACDANDDGHVNIADVVTVLGTAFMGKKALPAPALPGDDPTPDQLPCASWNTFAPVVTDGTVLSIPSCAIPGGATGSVETQVLVTTDQAINSVQFTLDLQGVPGARFEVAAVTGKTGFASVAQDGRTVAFINEWVMQKVVGPGEDIPILNLVICVPEGTPAGTYSLAVSNARAGKVSDLNAHTLGASTSDVTVQSAVTAGGECLEPTPPPEDPPPPASRGSYRLTGPSSIGVNDTTVTLTLQASTAKPAAALDVALDFNEAVLKLMQVEKTLIVGGAPAATFDVTMGPPTCETVVNDTLEGYVAMHIELADPQQWQVNQFYDVAKLTFELRSPPADLYGRTRFSFRNVGPDDAFVNKLRVLDGEVQADAPIQNAKNDYYSIALPGPTPPMVATSEDVQATFRLSEGAGSPGDTDIPVYFFIESNTAIQGFAAAFTYDTSILTIESVTSLANLTGERPDFLVAKTVTPADPAAPHGVVIAVVGDFMSEYFYYSGPNEPVACARFRILPDAQPGQEATIAFVDNVLDSPPVANVVVYQGASVTPGTEPTDVHVNTLKNGRVLVLGEVTPFLRGDANADYRLNIADAISVLGYLFAHAPALKCPDAGDANDDGTLDLADPIAMLSALFTPRKSLPAPYPGMGADPTMDFLGACRY